MELVVGERVIKGVIQTREQARETYEQAKRGGQDGGAARPGAAQHLHAVGGQHPARRADPRAHPLRGAARLRVGQLQLQLPDDGGPALHSAASRSPSARARARSPDTTAVPDASRITPPVLPPEVRSGHDIQLTVRLDAGLPVHDAALHLARRGGEARGRAAAPGCSCAAHDRIPNKTFTLAVPRGRRAHPPRRPGAPRARARTRATSS